MKIIKEFSDNSKQISEVKKVEVNEKGIIFNVLLEDGTENKIILEVPISNDIYKKMLQSFLSSQIK